MKSYFKKALLLLAIGTMALLQACGGGGTAAPTYVTPVISNINGSATASGTVGSTMIVYGTGFRVLSH